MGDEPLATVEVIGIRFVEWTEALVRVTCIGATIEDRICVSCTDSGFPGRHELVHVGISFGGVHGHRASEYL